MTKACTRPTMPAPVQGGSLRLGAAADPAASTLASRRVPLRPTVLARSAAAAALAALAAVGIAPAAGGFPAGPGAVLIGLCAGVDAMGRRIAVLPGHRPSGLPGLALEAAADAACRTGADRHPAPGDLRPASTSPCGLRGRT